MSDGAPPSTPKKPGQGTTLTANFKFDEHGNLVATDANGNIDPSKILTTTGSGKLNKVAVTVSRAAQLGGVNLNAVATVAWTAGTAASGKGKSSANAGKASAAKNSSAKQSRASSNIIVNSKTSVSHQKFADGADIMLVINPWQNSPKTELDVGYHITIPNTAAEVRASFDMAVPAKTRTGTITVNIPVGDGSFGSFDLTGSVGRGTAVTAGYHYNF